jgi:hypothetical protein
MHPSFHRIVWASKSSPALLSSTTSSDGLQNSEEEEKKTGLVFCIEKTRWNVENNEGSGRLADADKNARQDIQDEEAMNPKLISHLKLC